VLLQDERVGRQILTWLLGQPEVVLNTVNRRPVHDRNPPTRCPPDGHRAGSGQSFMDQTGKDTQVGKKLIRHDPLNAVIRPREAASGATVPCRR
jgi:hypothetical protein